MPIPVGPDADDAVVVWFPLQTTQQLLGLVFLRPMLLQHFCQGDQLKLDGTSRSAGPLPYLDPLLDTLRRDLAVVCPWCHARFNTENQARRWLRVVDPMPL